MSSSNTENGKDLLAVASRKLAAAEYRRARKAAHDPRNRLFSDSSDEVPKGILKNSRIPTKRSVSECVDDLSQIMADLNLNIHDLPKATRKFCPHHQFFNEEEEDEGGDDEEEADDEEEEGENSENRNNSGDERKFKDKCECNIKFSGDYGDNNNDIDKPKKSVRFDERVYETVFFASRLYDRRYFAKYHFSSRHHPPSYHSTKSKKSNKHQLSSKSSSALLLDSIKDNQNGNVTSQKLDNSNGGPKQPSKSQRAKQSKKDKKKRLQHRRESEVTDTSSDDQGYCSSMHSFSD